MATTADVSLGDFVKYIAGRMAGEQRSIPFKNERPWHYLFFELKSDKSLPNRPSVLDSLTFDWDGPYPKCQELSEFLHALHWTAAAGALNPSYNELQITQQAAHEWSNLAAGDGTLSAFLDAAFQKATEEFGR